MSTLGLVCARAGSIGLPHKNLAMLNGERLIERAIRIAFEAGCDEVAVSTDYTPGVDFDLGRALHVPRPPHLKGARVAKLNVWKHTAAAFVDAERVVDVDVTRPLRSAETVQRVIAALNQHTAVSAVTPGALHPAFDVLGPDGRPYDTERLYDARQELHPVYVSAGVWGFRTAELMRRRHIYDGGFHLVLTGRAASMDINDEFDWRLVQAVHDAGL